MFVENTAQNQSASIRQKIRHRLCQKITFKYEMDLNRSPEHNMYRIYQQQKNTIIKYNKKN